MTLKDWCARQKEKGDWNQKTFASDIGTSEAVISRIFNRKQLAGMNMMKKISTATGGKVAVREVIRELRPDIYEAVKGKYL